MSCHAAVRCRLFVVWSVPCWVSIQHVHRPRILIQLHVVCGRILNVPLQVASVEAELENLSEARDRAAAETQAAQDATQEALQFTQLKFAQVQVRRSCDMSHMKECTSGHSHVMCNSLMGCVLRAAVNHNECCVVVPLL